MGMWGEAWLITPFEKWTPHFQLKLQEKAGSPDRREQGNLREKGDLSVLLGHTGRAGWRVGVTSCCLLEHLVLFQLALKQ